MPTVSIAFLDKIDRANGAILTALLTLLNDREFDNGAERAKTPLVTVIGASNALPDVVALLQEYRKSCGAEQIPLSDRRRRQRWQRLSPVASPGRGALQGPLGGADGPHRRASRFCNTSSESNPSRRVEFLNDA